MLLSSIVRKMAGTDDPVWFEFVESRIFSKQVRELVGEVLAKIHSDLVKNPERGGYCEGNTWRAESQSR
jgi:hypothetical protein